MRGRKLAFVIFVVISAAPGLFTQILKAAKPQPPWPDRLIIGRRTYFDFGPPFDFYEVFSVATATEHTSRIERVQLTPPGDQCTQSATARADASTLNQSVRELLGQTNPCAIPSRELSREVKRCKHCLNFSGAEVVMQVSCGGESRRIHMAILDRDMFDPHAKTPEHTSWTMRLLAELDEKLGSAIVDRPAFTLDAPSALPKSDPGLPVWRDLESGAFDSLFDDKRSLSQLFLMTQAPPPAQTVKLTSSSVSPRSYTLPRYPPLAKLAHVSGQVDFVVTIKPDGHGSEPVFLRGVPLFQQSISDSLATWIFPTDTGATEARVTLDFEMNCGERSH